MRLARTSHLAAFAAIAAIVLAGCASSAQAGWTFAPVPSATAAPPASGAPASGAPASGAPASGAPASGAPASGAPASTGPTAGASSAPSGAPAPSGGSASVMISASNITFEQTSVDAPAGTPFNVVFDNKDAGVPHDVWIKDSTGNPVFQGAIVTGPTQTTYNVPALAAGSYTFNCSVHPNMTGTMVVK